MRKQFLFCTPDEWENFMYKEHFDGYCYSLEAFKKLASEEKEVLFVLEDIQLYLNKNFTNKKLEQLANWPNC